MQRQRPFYKTVLDQELARRTAANPRYSLRAFARALGIDVSVLSRVLTDKRTLSLRTASSIVEQLGLSLGERSIFLESVVVDQRLQALQRAGVETPPDDGVIEEVDAEVFKIISDLHHDAILELTRVGSFVDDPRAVAKALGLNVQEVRLAIARLLHVGLLEQTPQGLRRSNKQLNGDAKGYAASAKRHQQRQIHTRALESLENDAASTSAHFGLTMAIDPARLPEAKQLIANFIDQLHQLLEAKSPSRVYQLGISLFPLDRKLKHH